MLLLVFSTIVLVVVLVVIAALTHLFVVCCHFICLMLLFNGHFSYRNFAITGLLQCLQDNLENTVVI